MWSFCASLEAEVLSVPQDRPSERPLPLPEPTPTPPAPTIELPPLEFDREKTPALPAVRLRVQEFRFIGNTAIGADELASVVAPYRGREIDSDDLETIRVALTRQYVERGFVNSGAVLPDQEVTHGVVTFQIIEGRLTGVEVTGLKRLNASYVRDRLALTGGAPMNVYAIRDRLLLLQQDPRIQRLDAALLPGTRPGEAVLRVDVEEAPSRRAYVVVDNHRPPSVGAERASVELVDYDLTGGGDTLGLQAGATSGSGDVDVTYALPLSARDTALRVRYATTSSHVIEPPFDQLDIRSRSRVAALGVRYFVYRTPWEELGLDVGVEQRESASSLLGEPFAFSPGTPPDGIVRLTVLRFAQSWLAHGTERVLAARSLFSLGIDALDSTVGAEPDGRFVAWLGQAQWVQKLPAEHELVVRADAQLANDPLPSLEQFSVGGANSVRGYRENQLVRDSGVVASIEYRVPVWSDPGRGYRLQLASFYDWGRSSSRERPTPEPRVLASAGVGLRAQISTRVDASVYYGYRLRSVENSGSDLQDKGIHFELRARVW